MKDDDERIRMPEGAVGKVEVTLYRDGSVKTKSFPNEKIGRVLLNTGLDMLDGGSDDVDVTSIVHPTTTLMVAMGTVPGSA